MRCPFCDHDATRVIDSRTTETGDAIRRRRECENCGNRFTTYERIEDVPQTVVKRDGTKQAFDRQKLLRGLSRATNKRPVTEAQLDELADRIAAGVRGLGPEVEAARIGELALRGLAGIDPISAILFASVYRQFADLSELEAEVRRLREEPIPPANQLPLEEDD